MITNDVFYNQLDEIKNLTITARPQVTKEPVFNVILNTREIEVPAAFKNLAVYGEHKAETIWFALDRYFDGKDLFDKKAGVQFRNSQMEMLVPITYSKVNPDNKNEILLGWELTSDVTSVSGKLDFSLKIYKVDETTKSMSYTLNTKIASVNILNSLNVTDETENLNPPMDTLTTLVNTISELYHNQQTTNIDYDKNIKYDTLPQINHTTLIGNKSTADLKLQYADLLGLPSINGVSLVGNKTDAELGIKVEVDSALNISSVNPVQNKVVTASINTLNTNVASVTNKANANAAEIEAIKEELGNMTFIPIEITSFEHQLGVVEKGSVLEEIDLYWTATKAPISLKLDDASVGITNPIKKVVSLSEDTIFTLVASDGKTQDTAQTSVLFADGIYYGDSSATTYDNSFVVGLNKILSTDKVHTVTVNADGLDKHIFIAAPAAQTCTFKVGGFEGGFHEVETLDYTNIHNRTTSYKIYKSDNANLGTTTVTITLS